MSLSDRIRPDVEAAPWVIKEVKELEAKNRRLREALEWIATDFGSMGLYADVQVLRIRARAALEGKE